MKYVEAKHSKMLIVFATQLVSILLDEKVVSFFNELQIKHWQTNHLRHSF